MKTQNYKSLENSIKRLLSPDYRVDLALHGAEGGFPGITYYRDTSRFYNRHKVEIWGLAAEQAEELGYKNVFEFLGSFSGAAQVESVEIFENLLVWYAAEEICRRLVGYV